MRSPWFVLCVLGSVATARADAPEALRGNVLVWHDAKWFAEPSDTANPIALTELDGTRKDRIGHVVPMRVVSTTGAFVEVEPIDGFGCTWSRLAVPDDLAKLKLFVKRDDLAPVVTKPFSKAFGDGTTITLKPGVPVLESDGGFALAVRGDWLVSDLPSGSVGHSYVPDRAAATVIAGTTLAIAPGTVAAVGARSMALTGWEAAPVSRRGATTLVALEDRCTTIHAAVPTAAIKDSDSDEPSSLDMGTGSGAGNGVGMLGLRDEHYIPRLAPLSIGTRVVAYAAKPIYLMSVPTGKAACIERRLRLESSIVGLEAKPTDDKLRLCVPKSKVVREQMRSARSANGSTTR